MFHCDNIVFFYESPQRGSETIGIIPALPVSFRSSVFFYFRLCWFLVYSWAFLYVCLFTCGASTLVLLPPSKDATDHAVSVFYHMAAEIVSL